MLTVSTFLISSLIYWFSEQGYTLNIIVSVFGAMIYGFYIIYDIKLIYEDNI